MDIESYEDGPQALTCDIECQKCVYSYLSTQFFQDIWVLLNNSLQFLLISLQIK